MFSTEVLLIPMTSIRNDLDVRCPECGGKVILSLLENRVCMRCGKESMDREVCENGHHICDACRRKAANRRIMDVCSETTSKDPIEIAMGLMKDDNIRMHDQEHHTMVASALIAAYKNSGGEVDMDSALRDAQKRGSWFPGGICGLCGTCGASASCGIFYSIVTGTTPHSSGSWSDTNRLVSNCLGKISSIDGPRCCKRNSFISIIETVDYVKEKLDVEMDVTRDIKCTFSDRNDECVKGKCPFYKG